MSSTELHLAGNTCLKLATSHSFSWPRARLGCEENYYTRSMNMPKAIHQDLKEDDSHLFLKPHPYGNGGQQQQQQQQQGKKKANGEGQSNANGPHKKAVFDPTSTENVLKCYIKYHKASIESVKKKSNEITEKMLKTNMAIAERNQENALLRKQLQSIEQKVEELNKMSDALGQENRNLKEKCTAVEEKYVSLETAYDKEFALLKATLTKQKAELKQNDKLLEELKAVQLEKQQMVARLETMAQQKADEMAELQIKNAQLQLQISEVEAAFEQYKLQSVEQNEAVQAKLTAELQQQAAELTEQIEKSEKREAELQATLAKLMDVEKRGLKLQQINQQLTLEVSEVEKCLNAEIEQQKLKIEDLNSQIRKLKSDEQRYQDEIELLEEAKTQLEASKAEAAALAKCELSKVESHELKLKKNMEELQEEHLKITKALSAENAGLTQQLEALKQLYETKMNSLEEELNQKCAAHIDDQQQFAELERQKNATIAELTYKINQISTVFGQPVGTVGAMSNHQVGQKKTNEATISVSVHKTVAPLQPAAPAPTPDDADTSGESIEKKVAEITAMTPNTSGTKRRRTVAKRPLVNHYTSDFNTDTDDNDNGPDWKPPQPKLMKKNRFGYGNANTSRVRPSPQETENIFDKLKTSGN